MVYKGVFSRTSWPLVVNQCALVIVNDDDYQIKSSDRKKCTSQSINFPTYKVVNHFVWLLFLLIYQLPPCIDCFPANSTFFVQPGHHLNDSLLLQTSSKRVRNVPFDDDGHKIFGFRLEGDSSIISSDERYVVKADHDVTMRLFVDKACETLNIGFSVLPPGSAKESRCLVEQALEANCEDNIAVATINLPANSKPYHLCYSANLTEKDGFTYASKNHNSSVLFQIKSDAPMLPIWLHIILLIVLLIMSGLFSGLNLGLMALDKNELQVIERCGTEDEKYFAKTISPIRKRGNYLLCTLLLGNVLVNSTLTILLDDLTSGVFAVIVSTLSIVIFGEIIPQALCSRHGLAVGAKTAYITYLFMILTFPLSYPISKLLDKILGEEIGSVYDRERLMEYIRVTKDYNNLEADEMNIISGALKFKKISVSDVMTPINDVYMLPYDTILNFDALAKINNSGYSRIPVYENNRDNVIGLLHVKDLSLIDPDHNLPLKVVLDFYSHPLLSVYEDVKLDKMLNEFKQGKSHMALIRRVIDNGVNDPTLELLGVVTLEDIIEELIQAEINDETDVISDNRRKQKRHNVQSRSNYLDFICSGFKQQTLTDSNMDLISGNSVTISPQLALAACRFLTSSVAPFSSDQISEEVLKALMAKNIFFEARGELRQKNVDEMMAENVLYKRGQAADYFIMILEGRARVIVTKENQEYDAGPFCCFGINALTTANTNEDPNRSFNKDSVDCVSPKSSNQNLSQNAETVFVPDYTLICISKVIYMKISKNFYQMALKATGIERKRSIDLSQKPSITYDKQSDSDRPNLKVSGRLPPKYRKISMGTNLPESSLIKINHVEEVDDDDDDDDSNGGSEQIQSISNDPTIATEQLQKRKSSPNESSSKRSDAIELLSGKESPRCYGSFECLSESQPFLDNIKLKPDSNRKATRNGSLPALNEVKENETTQI